MIVHSRPRSFLRAVAVGIALGAPAGARAEYVNRDELLDLSLDSRWLYDAASEGVKAGVKSVTKELLTSVGKALAQMYSPALAEILFGSSDELEQHTQRVLSAIVSTHADLADRIRELGEDLDDQFDATVVGNYLAATNRFGTWLGYTNLLVRSRSADEAGESANTFEIVRNTVQRYIEGGATTRSMYRRLQLLPTHIAASQLAVTANRNFYGVQLLHAAFTESALGSDDGQFNAWTQTLSPEEIEDIRAGEPNFDQFERTVYTDVLSFYERLAESDPVTEYVDGVFTPAVSHMNKFIANRNMFDDADVVTNRDSWGTSPGPVTLLDGIRWYYYVNIPRANCLDGFAFPALTQTGVMPWHEVSGDLAGSDCNRFWFLDPSLATSGWCCPS